MTQKSNKPNADKDDTKTVCQFSYKVSYLTLGRLCKLSHPAGQSCFTWNKPEIFRLCPDRITYFAWQIENDLLESKK